MKGSKLRETSNKFASLPKTRPILDWLDGLVAPPKEPMRPHVKDWQIVCVLAESAVRAEA